MGQNGSVFDELTIIERENDVRIVFACDMEPDSALLRSKSDDLDVFFVFLRPISDYLLLEGPIERITRPKVSGIRAHGVDLRAFLRDLRSSDPFSVEILGSKGVFREDSRFWEVKRLQEGCFDPPKGAMRHLMAARADLDVLSEYESATPWHVLGLLRSTLAAKWCLRRFSPPPMGLDDLKGPFLGHQELDEAALLAEKAMSGTVSVPKRSFGTIFGWISTSVDSLCAEIGSYRHHETPDWAVFDRIFRSMAFL